MSEEQLSDPTPKLMELNPKYWYRDELGRVQKYYYCKLCLTGPFKKNDPNFRFTSVGRKHPMCLKCLKTLDIPDKSSSFT